jgi:Ca2+-binding EF-hand superfamily protein
MAEAWKKVVGDAKLSRRHGVFHLSRDLHSRKKPPLNFMKTIPVSLLAVGFLLPVIVCAQEESNRPGKEPRGGSPGSERGFGKGWKQADTNSDGKVTLEEFNALPRIQKLDEERRKRIFSRLDKNGDQVLSVDELAVIERPPHDRKEAMLRFRELDTDQSGGVSLEELKAGNLFKKLPPEKQEALFARLDTDKDGQITVKDRPERRPPGGADRKPDREDRPERGPNPRRMLRDFDKDGNGSVSFEEFRNAPPHASLSEDEQEDRFEALDKNGDKKLDETDFPPPPPDKRPGEGRPPKVPEGGEPPAPPGKQD